MKNKIASHHQTTNLSPSELSERLLSDERIEGARLFRELIDEELELSRRNLLKPYEDKIPLVLGMMDVNPIVEIFEYLDDYYIMKALFGNFRAVEEEKRQEILEGLSRKKTALLFNRMSIGVDNPKQASKILSKLPIKVAAEVVDEMETASVLRIFEEMPTINKEKIMAVLTTERIVELASCMLDSENIVKYSRLSNILKQLNKSKQQQILSRLKPHQVQILQTQILHQNSGIFDNINLREAKSLVSEMTSDEAVFELDKVDPEKSVDILKLCDATKAAQILSKIAQRSPQNAADVIEEINEKIIIGFRGSGRGGFCDEELYTYPAAAILENFDLNLDDNVKVIKLMRSEVLEPILDRMSEEKYNKITSLRNRESLSSKLPVSFQLFTVGKGIRRTVDLGRGMKWTRIEERLDTGEKVKPVIIDLVELKPKNVIIKACKAIPEDRLMSIDKVSKLFGEAKREGKRPDKVLFTELGLVQLSKIVKRSGAIAAINGNHYYDYGHYMDVISLGIDPTKVPGLFFGDPVGWFVTDGREISIPAFNRASLVITKDGKAYIERVFMKDVTLSNGNKVKWDAINSEKIEGLTILYNSIYGFKTKKSESHIDITIARDRIFEITPGGGGLIPFTGFILSIPVELKNKYMVDINVGDVVQVGNNFPESLGKVEQAMACGPYLVRDGQLQINFEEEDFGEKDSSVMAFSLTRSTETFEAARSFIMIREERLFIGTVSGTALGAGTPTGSAGMTFGELAQLTMDLRADHAYALDGGGSSSIAVRQGDKVRILNTPTGGSDVGKGQERFINTYWLFFEKDS